MRHPPEPRLPGTNWGAVLGRQKPPCQPSDGTVANVLLGLTDGDLPTSVLRQCSAFARGAHSDLHVLQVLAPERHPAAFVPELDMVHATRRVERYLSATRRLKAWCDDALPKAVHGRRLRIKIGDFMQQTESYAADLGAALIVLAPCVGRLRIEIPARASALLRPVLVARTSSPQARLLMATDLMQGDYCVFGKALELGARLGAPVVAVHNLSALQMTFHLESARVARIPAQVHNGDNLQRPPSETAEPRTCGDGPVRQGTDPLEAILQRACARHGPIIVVSAGSPRAAEWLAQPTVLGARTKRDERSLHLGALVTG